MFGPFAINPHNTMTLRKEMDARHCQHRILVHIQLIQFDIFNSPYLVLTTFVRIEVWFCRANDSNVTITKRM